MSRRPPGRPTTSPGGRRTGEERAPFALAVRLLGKRPLTEAEVSRHLAGAGCSERALRETLARLRVAGYLDDRRLALHYVVTRSERLGHGRDRLVAELERRGVERGIARAAWEEAVSAGLVDPAERLRHEAARRAAAAGGTLDRRAHARVYNALLRAGFEPEAIEAALEPYRAGLD